jgi:hypothetical protein
MDGILLQYVLPDNLADDAVQRVTLRLSTAFHPILTANPR